jgi:hypothetical protein
MGIMKVYEKQMHYGIINGCFGRHPINALIAKCSKFPSKTGCSYGSWLTKHGYFFNHGSIGCRLSMSISAYTPPNSYRIIYRNASIYETNYE